MNIDSSTAIILSMTVKDNERQPLSKSKKSYVVLNKIEDSNTGRTDLDNRKIKKNIPTILLSERFLFRALNRLKKKYHNNRESGQLFGLTEIKNNILGNSSNNLCQNRDSSKRELIEDNLKFEILQSGNTGFICHEELQKALSTFLINGRFTY